MQNNYFELNNPSKIIILPPKKSNHAIKGVKLLIFQPCEIPLLNK